MESFHLIREAKGIPDKKTNTQIEMGKGKTIPEIIFLSFLSKIFKISVHSANLIKPSDLS